MWRPCNGIMLWEEWWRGGKSESEEELESFWWCDIQQVETKKKAQITLLWVFFSEQEDSVIKWIILFWMRNAYRIQWLSLRLPVNTSEQTHSDWQKPESCKFPGEMLLEPSKYGSKMITFSHIGHVKSLLPSGSPSRGLGIPFSVAEKKKK